MSMLSNLRHFPFDGSDVRVVPNPDTPMFVANDVARALGYKDVRHAVQAHCRHGVISKEIIPDHLGRPQYPVIIPESDMYRLIFRSRLPSAERFADWVFEEVLPSIRKTGGYSEEDMTEHGRIAADRRSFDLWQMHNRHIKAKDAEIQALKDQMQELLHALD